MHNGFNWVPLGRPLLEPNIALKWAYFNMGHPRISLYSYYIILIFVLIVEPVVDRFWSNLFPSPFGPLCTFSDPKGVGQMFVSLPKCCQLSFLWANLAEFFCGTPMDHCALFGTQKGLVRSLLVYLSGAKSASRGPIWPIFLMGPLCTLGSYFDAKRGWSEVSQST